MNNQKPNFSTAIITGADGFLGLTLTKCLLSNKIKVIPIKTDITQRALLDAISLPPGSDGPSTVLFHLAALSQTNECSQNPERANTINHLGTVNVAQAFFKKGIRRVIFPSTGLVYGSSSKDHFLETDPVSPAGVYAETKLAAESALKTFSQESEISCIVARLGNIYGADASPHSVCAILLRQALQKEPLNVQTLRPIRDFIYVQDIAAGLMRLADYQPRNRFDLFNLSTGIATSIEQLAKTICHLTGHNPKIQVNHPDFEGTPPRLILDASKMTRELGWSVSWSLESGLRETIQQIKNK